MNEPVEYYDATFDWITNAKLKAAAKVVYPAANASYHLMQRIGETVSWVLGLQQSRFQYAVDEANAIERKKEQKWRREREAEKEKIRAHGLQPMDNEDDKDMSDAPYEPPISTVTVVVPSS